MVSAVIVAVGVGFAVWEATGHAARRPNGYRQGDCVVVKAQERGGELDAKAVRCDVDPSFTLAKVADRSTAGCQGRLPTPRADGHGDH